MSDAFYNSATSIRQLIGTATASGSSATLTFSSIPARFTHLLVYLMGQQTSGAGSDCTLQFNGDTGSNYDQVLWYGNNNTGPNAAGNTAGTSFGIGNAGTGTANPALWIMEIPFYTNTNWNKTMQSSQGFIQQSTGNARLTYGTFTWRNTAAITSITFTSGGGNWVANSVAYLYGLD
jgi:hypothetical protein